MRRIFALIAGLAWLTVAGAKEIPPAEPQPYVIAYSETHPYSAGVVTFLTEAYRRIGISVTAQPYPPGRSVELANRGDVDAEAARVPDAMGDMSDLIAVPEPIGHGDTYVFTTGAPVPVDGWDSLRGLHLCVMVGDLITMKRTQSMPREIVHDAAAQFRMLAKGRCEAAISDGAAWLLIDKEHLGRFRMMAKPVQSFPVYHYVNRRHADLIEPLAAAFRALHAEGFSQSLLAPYLAQIQESQARNSAMP